MSGQSHALLALVTRFRAEADKHEQLFQRQYVPEKDFSDEAYSKALNQAADELEAAIGLEVGGCRMKLLDGTWIERAVSVIGRFACTLAGDKDRFADYDECHLVMDALRASKIQASIQVLEDIEQLPFDSSAQSSGNSGALDVDAARQTAGKLIAWYWTYSDAVVSAETVRRECIPIHNAIPLYAYRGGQGDAISLAEHITDHLCHNEYDIGGRSELLACVVEALSARQPVGDCWSGWATQYPGAMPKLYGAREIAELNHHPEEGQRLIFLSEQPAQAAESNSNG